MSPARPSGRCGTPPGPRRRSQRTGRSLEGAVAVLAAGEPPQPLPAPAQNHPEAAQRMLPAPAARHRVEVAPVELGLLAGLGVDRHRHPIRSSKARPPDAPQLAGHRRIAATEALRLQTAPHADPQQPRMRGHQRLNPLRPAPRHRLGPIGRRPPPRRRSLLEPPGDRRGVKPRLSRDLLDRPTLLAQVLYLHERLLVHHDQGGSFRRRRACSLDTLEEPPPPGVDAVDARPEDPRHQRAFRLAQNAHFSEH